MTFKTPQSNLMAPEAAEAPGGFNPQAVIFAAMMRAMMAGQPAQMGGGVKLADSQSPGTAERRTENQHDSVNFADMIRKLLEFGLNNNVDPGPNGQRDTPIFMAGPDGKPSVNQGLTGQSLGYVLPFGNRPVQIEDPATFTQYGDIELPSSTRKPTRRPIGRSKR